MYRHEANIAGCIQEWLLFDGDFVIALRPVGDLGHPFSQNSNCVISHSPKFTRTFKGFSHINVPESLAFILNYVEVATFRFLLCFCSCRGFYGKGSSVSISIFSETKTSCLGKGVGVPVRFSKLSTYNNFICLQCQRSPTSVDIMRAPHGKVHVRTRRSKRKFSPDINLLRVHCMHACMQYGTHPECVQTTVCA